MSDDLYVTVPEAAKLIGCSRDTARIHALAGRLGAMVRDGEQRNAPILLLHSNVVFAIKHGHVQPSRIPTEIILIDAEWLADAGENADAVARRLGYTSFQALERLLYRYGRNDIHEKLVRNSHRHGLSRHGVPLENLSGLEDVA